MTPEEYLKEAHERHMTFLAAVGDLIEALNDYFESLYGKEFPPDRVIKKGP